MKKTISFLIAICFIFSSFVFIASAEDAVELEEYDGMLCVKGELVVFTNVYVEPVICEDGESADFLGISVVKIDAAFDVENGGPEKWAELTKNKFAYCIKVASDVDIYEARAFLEQQDCVLEVLFNTWYFDAEEDGTADDETETPVSKTVEFTESIFKFTSCDEQAMSEFGLQESFYGEESQPIIIDSRDMIDALSDCYKYGTKTDFDEYFAKYDEAFFEENALVVVLTFSPDYGYTYEALSLEYAEDGETLVFGFRCIHYFDDWPTECMYHLVMAEVKKEDIADCTSITTEYSYIDAIKGDANLDGTVDSIDYLMAKRAAFGTIELTQAQKMCANIYDHDSVIDSADYLLIKRIAFGTYTI